MCLSEYAAGNAFDQDTVRCPSTYLITHNLFRVGHLIYFPPSAQIEYHPAYLAGSWKSLLQFTNAWATPSSQQRSPNFSTVCCICSRIKHQVLKFTYSHDLGDIPPPHHHPLDHSHRRHFESTTLALVYKLLLSNIHHFPSQLESRLAHRFTLLQVTLDNYLGRLVKDLEEKARNRNLEPSKNITQILPISHPLTKMSYHNTHTTLPSSETFRFGRDHHLSG